MGVTRTESLRAALALGAALNLLAAVLVLRGSHVMDVLVAVGVLVAVTAVRPGAVLLAAVATLIVSADLLDLVAALPRLSVGGFDLQLTDILLAAMLLAWAVRDPQVGARFPFGRLARSAPFLPWLVFSLLGVYDLMRGGYGTWSSVRIFAYCIAVPLMARMVGSGRELRYLRLAVVSGGCVASVAAVVMFAIGRNVTPSGLSTSGVRGLSIGGSFLVAAALLGVLADVASGARIRPVTLAVVPLLLGGIVASGARETWVGMLGALVVFAVGAPLRGTSRIAVVFALVGLVALGTYAIVPHPPQVNQQLQALEYRLLSVKSPANDPSVSVRYDKWQVVWSQALAHPFFGTGFGYPATYTSNVGGNNFVRAYVDDPENSHLWLLARMGIVGFAAWAAFGAATMLQLLRRARSASGEARAAALWGAGVLIVVWAGMLFSPVSAFGSTLLLFWFGVALLPVSQTLAREEHP